MVELVLRKRRARAGEIGLFLESDVFEEEWGLIKMDTDVDVQATQRGTERHLKFSHVIAKWVADCNGEDFADAQDARDALLIECKHVRRKFDKLRDKAELVPKPTRDLDLTAWARLIKLMAYHAVATFNVPPEKFEREAPQYMQQPEPPPHTEIPDSPAHNARILREAVEAEEATAENEAAADRPEPARRDMDDGEDEPAPEPDLPPAAAAAKPDTPPDREPITWTVTMAGEPDWRIDLPGDRGMYAAYARGKLALFTDGAAWMIFWNSDDEWHRRKACGFGLTDRKEIERQAEQKEFKT